MIDNEPTGKPTPLQRALVHAAMYANLRAADIITREEMRLVLDEFERLRDGARVERVPEGWKLVPVEATDRMWVAGGNEIIRQYRESAWEEAKEVAEEINAATIWKAMLAAAPEPGGASNVGEHTAVNNAAPAGVPTIVNSPNAVPPVVSMQSETPRTDAIWKAFEAMVSSSDGKYDAAQRHVIGMIAALEREASAPKISLHGWTPVATLPPRDGEPGWAKTVLLLFPEADGEDQYNLGYYEPEGRVWCAHDGGGFYDEAVPPPTHWMPLPAAPASAPKAGEQR
jgi:hypothetical protein